MSQQLRDTASPNKSRSKQRILKRIRLETLETRILLASDLAADFEFQNAAALTAFLPDGVTLEELMEEAGQFATPSPDPGAESSQTPDNAATAGVSALISVVEAEPPGTSGMNDSPASAEPTPGFGTGAGEDGHALITGELSPPSTNLATSSSTPQGRIQLTGAYGTAAGPAALLMDVSVNGVFNLNEAIMTVDLTGVAQATLSVFHADFGDEQTALPDDFTGSAFGDGVAISNDGVNWHTVLNATNVTPSGSWQQVSIDLDAEASAAGMTLGSSFQIKFQQYDNFALTSDGRGYDEIFVTNDVTGDVIASETFAADVDFFSVDLEAGDIFGASVSGGATHLTLYDPSGLELIGSGQDLTFAHPSVSPLPGGGNAALSWVVDTAGTYSIGVDQGAGSYSLDVSASRPELETQQRRNHQALFLDFDGATIDAMQLFGMGNVIASLSPLSSFLGDWGLGREDEDAVIDAITATVERSFNDVGLIGNNGDFDSDGIDGHYDIEIITSRDSTDAFGFPFDPFSSENVSRVIVGGTISELGIGTLGIAESIDVGNFDTTETAVVLLDLLSSPGGPDSINAIPRDPGVSIIDAIGQVVGIITAHEAGHTFANWHTDQANAVPNIMDRGGNGIFDEAGVGPDGIFGTGDDVAVVFGKDVFVPIEGFSGTEDTLNSIAFGLSTGTMDPGMIVVGSSPATNERVFVAPTDFVIDFIDPYDPNSVDAADLTVNGIPADAVITDTDSLTFQYNSSPVTSQGLQTMSMAADAVTRLSDGDGVAAFSTNFGYDETLLQVVAIDPPGPIVELPLNSLTITLNEPYDPASVSANDLTVSRGSVVGFSLIDDVTIEFHLDGLSDEGSFTVAMADRALTDTAGNAGIGFAVDYELDFGLVPYPVPLTPKEPLGSLIYDPNMSGTIDPAGDTDSFAILVDPGQRMTVVVEPDAALQPTISIARDGATLDSSSAAAAGEVAVLQTVATHGPIANNGPQPKTYVVTVGGDLAGPVGGYEVQVILNAAVEEESYGGPENNSPDTAQDIDPSFLALLGASDNANGPARGAVLGSLERVILYEEGFESGSLGPEWSTFSSDAGGRILVSDTLATPPNSGDFHLTMDRFPRNPFNLNEAILTLDLSGVDQVDLSFWQKDVGDEEHPLPASFVGSVNGDGVSISEDGITWHTLISPFNTPSREYTKFDFDLDAAVATAGISLGADFKIKFQQYDNFPFNSDGRTFDDIMLATSGKDMFSFNLAAGQTATVVATGSDQLDVEVLDSLGNTVAVGSPINDSALIKNFSAPATDTYIARVRGPAETDYSLLVTRDADFGLETGNDIASAHQLDNAQAAGRQWILGHHAGGRRAQLYGGGVDGEIFTIDLTTGAGSFLGSLQSPGRVDFLDIDHDNLTGDSYAQARLPFTNGIPFVLPFDIDAPRRFTQFQVTRDPTGALIQLDGLEWVGSSLYAAAPSGLQILDPLTGRAAPVGPTVGQVKGLAYDPTVGVMYGIAGGPGASDLYTIDLGTGVATLVGPTGMEAGSLQFGPDGNLYAGGTGVSDGGLYQIDPATGVSTLVGATGFSSVTGLTLREADIDGDFYEVTLSEGQPLEVETFTPAFKAGEIVNDLDPMINVYDAAGNLVATDDNSGKGNNARLMYKVPNGAAGVYYVEVTSSEQTPQVTTGEYILSIKGNGDQRAVAAIAVAVGDANHDGLFDTSDLVKVFQAGEYEDDIEDNSTFDEGDWDGDGEFTSADLVFAFQLLADSVFARHEDIGDLIDSHDERIADGLSDILLSDLGSMKAWLEST